MKPASEIPPNTWIRAFVQGRGEISMEVCAKEAGPSTPHTTKAKDLRGTLYLVRSRFGALPASGEPVVGYNATEIKP